ncbi:phytanoyl-CoA dioxygenase family protein [Snodgrassella sp. CFCC 13594]|uniref:phytanoyl-CoA dioxygenase family protein n=1 Tax=Snodgrassella sp. CFCC 13594 TaxID=1775559 RepID=UPI00082B9EF4|nr:phytanoyl-CoA dioxygenase family protein [Snodgrassella sp. CFCC 13594]
MNYRVSEDSIASFQRDGAVCLRGLLSADAITTLKTGVEKNMQQPSSRAKWYSKEGDSGRFFQDFCCWDRIPEYHHVVFDSDLGPTAAALMGSNSARLNHDHILVKEAGTSQKTPWHQDQPYYNLDGHQNISFWIPVDPVPRESTLEFVAGTHLGPWLMPRGFKDNDAKWFPEGSLAELPDIESHREDFPILGWALEPGDVVCFNMLTLHASQGSKNTRRAYSVRVTGDDMVHAPRPWKTSPEFPGLNEELPAGSPLAHPLFPLLWPKEAQQHAA